MLKPTAKWTLAFLAIGLLFMLPLSKSSPDTKIYDYSSDVGVDRWAYYLCSGTSDLIPGAPPFGTEFNSANYTAVSVSDDSWASPCDGVNPGQTHLYKLEMPSNSNITELNWLIEGHTGGGGLIRYHKGLLWNFSSSAWVTLYDAVNELSDVVHQGSLSSAIDDYVDGSDIMYFASHSNAIFGDGTTQLFDDYVTFNITYTVTGDTCDTCTIDCTENCVIDSALDCEGGTLSFTGSGPIGIQAEIINYAGEVSIDGGCWVICDAGGWCIK